MDIGALIYEIGFFVYQYSGIFVLLFFSFVGYLVYSKPEQPPGTVQTWVRNPPPNYESRYHQERPDLIGYKEYKNSPEYRNAGIIKTNPTAHSARIVYKFQAVTTPSQATQIHGLEKRKQNLLTKKESFLEHASIEQFNETVKKYDMEIEQINNKIILDSKIYSTLNPVIKTTPAPRATAPRQEKISAVINEATYKKYIHSNIFKTRSKAFKLSKNGVCDKCKLQVGFNNLRTHHLFYVEDLFKDDSEANWSCLCRTCHAENHDRQKKAT